MGRELSPFLSSFFADRAALDNRVYNTQFALDITLRTGGPLRLSTKDLTLSSYSYHGTSVDFSPAQSYSGKLQSIPEIFYSQDTTSDGSGVFEAVNLDYLLSAVIPEMPRVLDKARVVGYMCFPKTDGTYEALILGKGVLRLLEGDDQLAQLSYVSDINDKTVLLGGHELTQRCLNVFRVIDPLRRSWCGAANDSNIPENATCSLEFDDEENGCVHYGQEATFQGVSFFNPNAVPNYGGPYQGGGFYPSANYQDRLACCDEAGWWLFSDGTWRGGENVVEGCALLDPHGRVGVVSRVERVWADYRYLVTTSSGTQAVCTPSHPALTSHEDESGTPLIELFDQKNARILDYGTRAALSRFNLRVAPPGWVLKISMTEGRRLYVSGARAGAGIGGHNKMAPYEK